MGDLQVQMYKSLSDCLAAREGGEEHDDGARQFAREYKCWGWIWTDAENPVMHLWVSRRRPIDVRHLLFLLGHEIAHLEPACIVDSEAHADSYGRVAMDAFRILSLIEKRYPRTVQLDYNRAAEKRME